MRMPLVSVVMPAYNAELYVNESINSILTQTYSDFEFIIINDASTDNTSKVLGSIKDDRIIYLNNKQNKGNYACRNQGCKLARGEYICVMDADDMAMPERIQRQVQVMESDSSILACGSDFEFVGLKSGMYQKPKRYDLLKVFLLFNNMFLHPSLIIRKETLKKVGFYDEQFYYSSDYDLMCKIALEGKVINLPDLLMKYRVHEKQISSEYISKQIYYADQIRIQYLEKSGFTLKPHDKLIFTKLMRKEFDKISLETAERIFGTLKKQNSKLNYFDQNILNRFSNIFLTQLEEYSLGQP